MFISGFLLFIKLQRDLESESILTTDSLSNIYRKLLINNKISLFAGKYNYVNMNSLKFIYIKLGLLYKEINLVYRGMEDLKCYDMKTAHLLIQYILQTADLVYLTQNTNDNFYISIIRITIQYLINLYSDRVKSLKGTNSNPIINNNYMDCKEKEDNSNIINNNICNSGINSNNLTKQITHNKNFFLIYNSNRAFKELVIISKYLDVIRKLENDIFYQRKIAKTSLQLTINSLKVDIKHNDFNNLDISYYKTQVYLGKVSNSQNYAFEIISKSIFANNNNKNINTNTPRLNIETSLSNTNNNLIPKQLILKAGINLYFLNRTLIELFCYKIMESTKQACFTSINILRNVSYNPNIFYKNISMKTKIKALRQNIMVHLKHSNFITEKEKKLFDMIMYIDKHFKNISFDVEYKIKSTNIIDKREFKRDFFNNSNMINSRYEMLENNPNSSSNNNKKKNNSSLLSNDDYYSSFNSEAKGKNKFNAYSLNSLSVILNSSNNSATKQLLSNFFIDSPFIKTDNLNKIDLFISESSQKQIIPGTKEYFQIKQIYEYAFCNSEIDDLGMDKRNYLKKPLFLKSDQTFLLQKLIKEYFPRYDETIVNLSAREKTYDCFLCKKEYCLNGLTTKANALNIYAKEGTESLGYSNISLENLKHFSVSMYIRIKLDNQIRANICDLSEFEEFKDISENNFNVQEDKENKEQIITNIFITELIQKVPFHSLYLVESIFNYLTGNYMINGLIVFTQKLMNQDFFVKMYLSSAEVSSEYFCKLHPTFKIFLSKMVNSISNTFINEIIFSIFVVKGVLIYDYTKIDLDKLRKLISNGLLNFPDKPYTKYLELIKNKKLNQEKEIKENDYKEDKNNKIINEIGNKSIKELFLILEKFKFPNMYNSFSQDSYRKSVIDKEMDDYIINNSSNHYVLQTFLMFNLTPPKLILKNYYEGIDVWKRINILISSNLLENYFFEISLLNFVEFKNNSKKYLIKNNDMENSDNASPKQNSDLYDYKVDDILINLKYDDSNSNNNNNNTSENILNLVFKEKITLIHIASLMYLKNTNKDYSYYLIQAGIKDFSESYSNYLSNIQVYLDNSKSLISNDNNNLSTTKSKGENSTFKIASSYTAFTEKSLSYSYNVYTIQKDISLKEIININYKFLTPNLVDTWDKRKYNNDIHIDDFEILLENGRVIDAYIYYLNNIQNTIKEQYITAKVHYICFNNLLNYNIFATAVTFLYLIDPKYNKESHNRELIVQIEAANRIILYELGKRDFSDKVIDFIKYKNYRNLTNDNFEITEDDELSTQLKDSLHRYKKLISEFKKLSLFSGNVIKQQTENVIFQILKRLEDATWKGDKDKEMEVSDDAKEITQESPWHLVSQFCKVNNYEMSLTMLHHYARKNNWILFLYKAQDQDCKPSTVKKILEGYLSDEILKTHLKIIIQEVFDEEEAPKQDENEENDIIKEYANNRSYTNLNNSNCSIKGVLNNYQQINQEKQERSELVESAKLQFTNVLENKYSFFQRDSNNHIEIENINLNNNMNTSLNNNINKLTNNSSPKNNKYKNTNANIGKNVNNNNIKLSNDNKDNNEPSQKINLKSYDDKAFNLLESQGISEYVIYNFKLKPKLIKEKTIFEPIFFISQQFLLQTNPINQQVQNEREKHQKFSNILAEAINLGWKDLILVALIFSNKQKEYFFIGFTCYLYISLKEILLFEDCFGSILVNLGINFITSVKDIFDNKKKVLKLFDLEIIIKTLLLNNFCYILIEALELFNLPFGFDEFVLFCKSFYNNDFENAYIHLFVFKNSFIALIKDIESINENIQNNYCKIDFNKESNNSFFSHLLDDKGFFNEENFYYKESEINSFDTLILLFLFQVASSTIQNLLEINNEGFKTYKLLEILYQVKWNKKYSCYFINLCIINDLKRQIQFSNEISSLSENQETLSSFDYKCDPNKIKNLLIQEKQFDYLSEYIKATIGIEEDDTLLYRIFTIIKSFEENLSLYNDIERTHFWNFIDSLLIESEYNLVQRASFFLFILETKEEKLYFREQFDLIFTVFKCLSEFYNNKKNNCDISKQSFQKNSISEELNSSSSDICFIKFMRNVLHYEINSELYLEDLLEDLKNKILVSIFSSCEFSYLKRNLNELCNLEFIKKDDKLKQILLEVKPETDGIYFRNHSYILWKGCSGSFNIENNNSKIIHNRANSIYVSSSFNSSNINDDDKLLSFLSFLKQACINLINLNKVKLSDYLSIFYSTTVDELKTYLSFLSFINNNFLELKLCSYNALESLFFEALNKQLEPNYLEFAYASENMTLEEQLSLLIVNCQKYQSIENLALYQILKLLISIKIDLDKEVFENFDKELNMIISKLIEQTENSEFLIDFLNKNIDNDELLADNIVDNYLLKNINLIKKNSSFKNDGLKAMKCNNNNNNESSSNKIHLLNFYRFFKNPRKLGLKIKTVIEENLAELDLESSNIENLDSNYSEMIIVGNYLLLLDCQHKDLNFFINLLFKHFNEKSFFKNIFKLFNFCNEESKIQEIFYYIKHILLNGKENNNFNSLKSDPVDLFIRFRSETQFYYMCKDFKKLGDLYLEKAYDYIKVLKESNVLFLKKEEKEEMIKEQDTFHSRYSVGSVNSSNISENEGIINENNNIYMSNSNIIYGNNYSVDKNETYRINKIREQYLIILNYYIRAAELLAIDNCVIKYSEVFDMINHLIQNEFSDEVNINLN